MASKTKGLSLIEVIVGVGILGFAILALLTVLGSALNFHRQTNNHSTAVRVNDMVLERAVAGVLHDTPAGTSDDFWDNDYPYPSTPYREGEIVVGREDFQYAVYAVDVPGVGDPDADPPNRLRKIDAYVWWQEPGQAGQKRTFSTRLVNSGEQP